MGVVLVTGSSSASHQPTPDASIGIIARREARISLWMLAVFAGWTGAFVVLSSRVAAALGAPMSDGEVVYIEQWAPWIAVTIVWLLPLLVGIGLALDARRRAGEDALARTALVVHCVVVVGATGPALLDRLLHLG